MRGREVSHLIQELDGYLCELAGAQIRDGLHVLGQVPEGEQLVGLLQALTRLPNLDLPSLRAATASLFGLDLDDLLREPGRKLASIPPDLERLAGRPLASQADALEGGYVPAGPSGAPTRGMAHVLPTGRNFYAVDPRAVPSAAAWQVGQELAREVVERYRSETGEYPESVGISAWGTSAMRTHGDDVAEVLALLGVRPVWQKENRRVTGVEVVPLEALGRPRIDVTVRISGFFRDAFPHLIQLLDDAVRAVALRDEPPERNFVRKHYLADL